MHQFSRENILKALEMLSKELEQVEAPYELIIAGGAAMVLLYGARSSTKDVDAVHCEGTVREAPNR